MQVILTLDVPQVWIDQIAKHSDLFSSYGIGYWAIGLRKGTHGRAGWLIRDVVASERDSDTLYSAVHAFERGTALPEHYYALDEALAAKAYIEAVKLYGLDCINRDATVYDRAIQRALWGEERYG